MTVAQSAEVRKRGYPQGGADEPRGVDGAPAARAAADERVRIRPHADGQIGAHEAPAEAERARTALFDFGVRVNDGG